MTWCKIQAKAQVGNIRVDLDWDGWDWINGDFGEIVHYTLRFVFRNKLFVGKILIKNGTISMKVGTIAVR